MNARMRDAANRMNAAHLAPPRRAATSAETDPRRSEKCSIRAALSHTIPSATARAPSTVVIHCDESPKNIASRLSRQNPAYTPQSGGNEESPPEIDVTPRAIPSL